MSDAKKWSAWASLTLGFGALAILVLVLGVWSVTARIAGAIIASGSIEVESNQQVIQHPAGGVVGEIVARDGDVVEAGDVVLRLDDSALSSELSIIEGQLQELFARKQRLQAERNGLTQFPEPDYGALPDGIATNRLPSLLSGQQGLFEARGDTLTKEIEQLSEQTSQIQDQIIGINAQLRALEEQHALIAEELTDTETLLQKGLVQISRVLALRREKARQSGELGRLAADIARLRGQISGIELQKLQLQSTRREEALSELRDLQVTELELIERRLANIELLSRLEIRAPVGGVIHGSSVFALRSVVRAADPLMYVVPQDQPLVVTAQIEAINIDQIYVGQDAALKFAAFDQRTTPEIFGRVAHVSADVFQDSTTGLNFYRAELLPLEGEIEKLGDLVLVPGMPVEAFIKTNERSPLSYLAKPLTDYFQRAFREG